MLLNHIKLLRATTKCFKRFRRNEIPEGIYTTSPVLHQINNGSNINSTRCSSEMHSHRGVGRLAKTEKKLDSKVNENWKYQEGSQYEGFECFRCEKIPEFGITSYSFRHLKSGTELWYVDRADTNKVFSVNFRTTPFDSTGLPHILEHCVLCGSEQYPIRDPFFKMLNRSVATFMNAMTGADYTMYPFSTLNEIDYNNLQRIYLDAVFR